MRAFKNLREFLQLLEAEKQLLRISEEVSLEPDLAAEPEGISHKMIIDATTPVLPDRRGNFSQQLDSPQQTDEWRKKLSAMLKELRK
jgi:3-polyprenyl-4-hydroxybenzoate decarboxylase